MVSTLRAFVFFSPSSFSSIDRSVAREAEEEEEKEEEEKEEEEKEEDFLASFFFSIFFLLLKMMMTSKNVSTGEFVSELKYVSTFLTDKRAKDALVPENIFQLRAPVAGCRVENVHDFRFPVRF